MFELGFSKTTEQLEITIEHERNTEIVRTTFFWSVAGYTVYDHKTHEIRELNIYNLNKITVNCRCQWTLYLLQMHNTCIPKIVYAYTPTDRINVGQPRKIHRDAPPTDDRTCLDGLYSVFTAASAIVSIVVVDDDDDELGMCI